MTILKIFNKKKEKLLINKKLGISNDEKPSDEEVELYTCEGISNLKLQKILYFLYGFYYALKGKELFNVEFKAWEYGPVVYSFYKQYKKHGRHDIEITDEIKNIKINYETKGIDKGAVKKILYFLFDTSVWDLVDLSHQTYPWYEAKTNGKSEIIDNKKIQEYFTTNKLIMKFLDINKNHDISN